MYRFFCFVLGILALSACASNAHAPSPNTEKMYHPDIALYKIKSGTKLDSLLFSLSKENGQSDIHIWETTSPLIVVFLTEKGCIPPLFIDAPPLIGYCMYYMHSCYIYGASETNLIMGNYLIRENNLRISLDSILYHTSDNTCNYKTFTLFLNTEY